MAIVVTYMHTELVTYMHTELVSICIARHKFGLDDFPIHYLVLEAFSLVL